MRLQRREPTSAERTHAGTYDELALSDAVSYLRKQPKGSCDLVVGADVCVYMRSLSDMVAAAEEALTGFSVNHLTACTSIG